MILVASDKEYIFGSFPVNKRPNLSILFHCWCRSTLHDQWMKMLAGRMKKKLWILAHTLVATAFWLVNAQWGGTSVPCIQCSKLTQPPRFLLCLWALANHLNPLSPKWTAYFSKCLSFVPARHPDLRWEGKERERGGVEGSNVILEHVRLFCLAWKSFDGSDFPWWKGGMW